ncbi:hypothetical protein K443DRAFT_536550 [Laccaria amethystina LaAM-08-1]|uniref:Uncharacterized protein n=1 Tax=Laccaria amethystina LaAM-08-1 TaxID=1095629 RepID=A0A0C9XX43_9AGAR|nr:hypothetical protein K443DRAFT_536550 [Laccaria amethystina LaAM-08-1]
MPGFEWRSRLKLKIHSEWLWKTSLGTEPCSMDIQKQRLYQYVPRGMVLGASPVSATSRQRSRHISEVRAKLRRNSLPSCPPPCVGCICGLYSDNQGVAGWCGRYSDSGVRQPTSCYARMGLHHPVCGPSRSGSVTRGITDRWGNERLVVQ